jgi:hypothetical protein
VDVKGYLPVNPLKSGPFSPCFPWKNISNGKFGDGELFSIFFFKIMRLNFSGYAK